MHYGTQADQIARQRSLIKRRKAATNRLTILLMVPFLILFFVFLRETTDVWLYNNGILPDYGIAQLFEGRQQVNWDRVLVSGVVGALIGLVANMVGSAFAWLTVR